MASVVLRTGSLDSQGHALSHHPPVTLLLSSIVRKRLRLPLETSLDLSSEATSPTVSWQAFQRWPATHVLGASIFPSITLTRTQDLG